MTLPVVWSPLHEAPPMAQLQDALARALEGRAAFATSREPPPETRAAYVIPHWLAPRWVAPMALAHVSSLSDPPGAAGFMRESRLLTCQSQQAAQWARRRWGLSPHIVSAGPDPVMRRREIMAPKFTIGIVGNDRSQGHIFDARNEPVRGLVKGTDTLRDALSLLGPRALRIVFAGSTWSAASLPRRLSADGYEVVCRHETGERLAEVYQDLDVVLVLSRTETGPLAALDALACGVPVVGRPVGELPEILPASLLVGEARQAAPILQQMARDRLAWFARRDEVRGWLGRRTRAAWAQDIAQRLLAIAEDDSIQRPRPRSAPARPIHVQVSARESVCVVLASRNRADGLRRVLEDLALSGRDHDLKVIVGDDASDQDPHLYVELQEMMHGRGWTYFRAAAPHGKERYCDLVGELYRRARETGARWVMQLADDLRAPPNLISRALATWRAIRDPKLATLNLLADARIRTRFWTGGAVRDAGAVVESGWVDGIFVAPMDVLAGITLASPPASRWAGRPGMSSGLGEQMSRSLAAAGRTLYGVRESLVVHVEGPSEMHPEERRRHPLLAQRYVEGPRVDEALRSRAPVYAALAAIPRRADVLPRVVDSLYWQVDELRVYLNGWDEIPSCLHRPRVRVMCSDAHHDIGDAGKFWWHEDAPDNCYLLTCDDDIVYPPDYVATMLRAVERYERRAIVTAHGGIIPGPHLERSYYRERRQLHCAHQQAQDEPAHVPGTGVMALHSSTLRLLRSAFRAPNMADVWVAVEAMRARVPVVVLARRAGWIEVLETQDTIYDRARLDDSRQAAALNACAPWAPAALPEVQ